MQLTKKLLPKRNGEGVAVNPATIFWESVYETNAKSNSGIIVRILISLMDKAGTYRFVLHFYDDYADSYKNHQFKATLEVNAPKPLKVFHIEDDWMVTSDGRKLDPLARSPEVRAAFMRAGWIVHTAGSKCSGKVCVLPRVCTNVPYKETLPTRDERVIYSRDHFFYYDNRNTGRYVHLIGAAYMIGPGDGKYGMSDESERYSYVFVKLHLDIGGATKGDIERYIKTTTIHELGHQFGLDDHPINNTPTTRHGKLCVMYDGAPTAFIDMEFCNGCLNKIRNYKGW